MSESNIEIVELYKQDFNEYDFSKLILQIKGPVINNFIVNCLRRISNYYRFYEVTEYKKNGYEMCPKCFITPCRYQLIRTFGVDKNCKCLFFVLTSSLPRLCLKCSIR